MTDQIQKQNAPYAVAALVLGICSIVFGCMIVGLVCGIVGLVLAKKGTEAFNAAPDQYAGDGMLRAGKITSIIGIILSALGIIYWVIWVAIFGTLYSSLWASLM
ncbi:MAG: DUF4190 domain-containing protein [Bacteroidales bacterium]|nr:DUF4190 domain-containing protein [Bacteroidales bacterium]